MIGPLLRRMTLPNLFPPFHTSLLVNQGQYSIVCNIYGYMATNKLYSIN